MPDNGDVPDDDSRLSGGKMSVRAQEEGRDAPGRKGSARIRTALDETYALIVAEIPRLRRYARFLVRDPELADDLVQECLTRAVAKLDSWEVGSNMRAWLFVILHNVYISHWRRVKRSPATVEMSPSDPALAVLGSQEQHLGMIDVQTAFNKLGEDHKQILLMVGVEGLRYEDAAAVLDLPVGTVRSRLFRARSALRQLLEGNDAGNDEGGR